MECPLEPNFRARAKAISEVAPRIKTFFDINLLTLNV
jgi:hypothetical protein